MTKKIITLFLLFFSPLLIATKFVCPHTFKTILTGYSMAQVIAACGQPTSVTHSEGEVTLPVRQMQWIYTLPSTTTFNGHLFAPQMVIVFEDDLVVEISSNHPEAFALFHCYRSDRIAIGNSSQQVLQQCGSPNFVNYLQRAVPHVASSSEWIYNFGSYRPQMIFIFQNGILQQIERGPLPQ